MPRSVIVIIDATVTFGPVPPGTGTPVDFSCQVNSAAITPSANNVDVPATFCAGPSQTAQASSFSLDLTFLQDWGATGSVSQFLFDNDAVQAVPFTVSGISVAGNPIEASGTCTIVAAAYGGEAGVALTADASLPIDGKPTIGPGTVTAADETPADETADVATFQPA